MRLFACIPFTWKEELTCDIFALVSLSFFFSISFSFSFSSIHVFWRSGNLKALSRFCHRLHMIYITLSCILLHFCFSLILLWHFLWFGACQMYIVVSLSFWKLPAIIKFYMLSLSFTCIFFFAVMQLFKWK